MLMRLSQFPYGTTAAGADPDGDFGEAHNPETHLIPLVQDVLTGLRENIKIFGDDYDTPNGTCIRDYIYVSDLADAHILALQALDRGANSAVYNLGNGNGFSVSIVIAAAEVVTGLTAKVVTAARREGDPPRLVGDPTRAYDQLGWKPKVNDIHTIIEKGWRWNSIQTKNHKAI